MKKSASIVCIGGWNLKIFTPQWVSSKLFEIPEGNQMNVQVSGNLVFSFMWNELTFTPTEKFVELKCENVTDNNLKQIVECFSRLIGNLSQTPIEAFGYNIKFDFSKDEFSKTSLCPFDGINLNKNYNTTSVTIKSHTNDHYVKAIVVESKEDSVSVTFNLEYKNMKFAGLENGQYEIVKNEIKNVLGNEYGIN